MRSTSANTDTIKYIAAGPGQARKMLEIAGRLPTASVLITPIDPLRKPVVYDRFLQFNLQSSILIPVDAFSFTLAPPADGSVIRSVVRSGDIATVYINEIPIFTGIVDTTDVEVEASSGESISIIGRDLMGQLEDQDAISVNESTMYGSQVSITQAVARLVNNTRISSDIILSNASDSVGLFATGPSESKLSALQRFIEPYNLLFWMSPSGRLTIGKPNMDPSSSRGTFFMIQGERKSNVISMKATRATATIANVITPIFASQETAQYQTAQQQSIYNKMADPATLYKQGHRIAKSIVISDPSGKEPSDLSKINEIVANQGQTTRMIAQANRELARSNINDLMVQVVIPQLVNEFAEPILPDTCYHIIFDRDEIDEVMYLFEVDYQLDENRGLIAVLKFCRLGTIVANVKVGKNG